MGFRPGGTGTGTPGYELMLGVRRDPGFGPVLLCGAGGMAGEIFGDCALALPPLNRVLARQLIEASRAYQLLMRNQDELPALLLLLEEILIRLSQLVTDFPEVVELEIDPLILNAHAAAVMSASVEVEPANVAAPQHLVISSYPSQYEMETVTKGGMEIFLRPIKPEDAPLLVELFHSLSPTSVYFRFFIPISEASPQHAHKVHANRLRPGYRCGGKQTNLERGKDPGSGPAYERPGCHQCGIRHCRW